MIDERLNQKLGIQEILITNQDSTQAQLMLEQTKIKQVQTEQDKVLSAILLKLAEV